MATQLQHPRSSRVVVLVSPAEKQRIADSAAAADMTVSDYMRTAAERYSEPSEAEQMLMRELLIQLEAANASTEKAFAALETEQARAATFDENAYRTQVREQLLTRTDIDWNALGEALSGGTRQ
ncbi:plasmid mobilization protein [Sphingomonas psychrotolerans]|uniref:Ribbon-helix-helix protein, CopG family n=1 Tax=Sphingomonas psychrotolerans TaxID=1327635 RepID=A0A2K8MED7_9SPHN|nr:hypothetical protein [Sphingomonas psychrotolerans]ATY32268.1 hypothetical protein CVN68_09990 [Sphingomonas psychrotolerans]